MNVNITQNLWAAKEWARVKAAGDDYVHLVHEATNEEKWGPTGEQMEAICRNYPRGGATIMEELQWKLKNRDKAWRPCYKSLLVLDYLARNVKDNYLPEICAIAPTLRVIAQGFYYTNPKGVDHGVSVRERAKNLADLLSDGLLLREERAKAAATKAKLAKGACEGGGPGMYQSSDRYGGYSGGGGGGYNDRYGGYSGSGGGASRHADRYGGYSGSAGGNAGGSRGYDPYVAPRRRTPSPPREPRSKAEQERYDMEMALRMQREEERRAGVSAEQLETMYAKKVQKRQERAEAQRRNAADTDEDLARKLQEEEETRARREGRALPTLRSDNAPEPKRSESSTVPTTPPAASSAPAPTPEKPAPAPQKDVLDDLFAPAPAAPSQQPPAQGGGDPFDAFLDSRAQQQQQTQGQWGQPQSPGNQWGQPQQQQPQQSPSGNWGAPQPQQQNQWGQPQSPGNQWGQPQQQPQPQQQQQQQQQQPQQSPSGNWGAPPQQQQNQWGQPQSAGSAGDQWGQPQQQPQPQQSPSGNWGAPQQPQQQQNQWGQPQQVQSADPWSQQQPQQQQQQNQWGQPAQAPNSGAPAQQQNSWGGYGGDSSASQSGAAAGGGASADPMWATFNQFNQQQQRK